MSDCEDGKYEIGSSPYEEDCVFSYVGGPEGTQSWIYEYPIVLTLFKKGDLVSIWPDFPLDDYDGVEEVEKAKSVASVNYYNLAGVESAEPFDGLSIKVTTYSDGTRSSEKVIR